MAAPPAEGVSMVFWICSVWVFGVLATLYRYFDVGHDMYRPCAGLIIRKPYRVMFRDLAWIVFAWPLVIVWAVYRHIKWYW